MHVTDDAARDEPPFPAQRPETQPVDAPFSLRILVVEDSHDSADSLGLLLNLWGYQAVITYDGEGALQAASANPPDVVFLDIGLPGMDGCQVARQLRRLSGTAHSLLVAITGYGREADVQRCKEAGIDRHFLKPVDPVELKQLLAKAETSGHQQRQLAC